MGTPSCATEGAATECRPYRNQDTTSLQKDFAYLRVAAKLYSKMKLKSWIKTLGFWGFMFFLVKGLLWLSIPALIALFYD